MMSPELLNSWKEISNYVGRGVRTVQRWERELGLPVRRPAGHVRGAVIALRSDIDIWLKSRDLRMQEIDLAGGHPPCSREDCCRVRQELKRMREHLRLLQLPTGSPTN